MEKANFFNHHLVESGENYFEHFLFAFTTAMWILLTGVIMICHAIFPSFFTTTGSSNIKKINELMQKRKEMLMARIELRLKQKAAGEEEV